MSCYFFSNTARFVILFTAFGLSNTGYINDWTALIMQYLYSDQESLSGNNASSQFSYRFAVVMAQLLTAVSIRGTQPHLSTANTEISF